MVAAVPSSFGGQIARVGPAPLDVGRHGGIVRAPWDRLLCWYFSTVFGRGEGPGATPFYCDPAKVGSFAIRPDELSRGGDAALFRLFVTMSMFQALRDVVIMHQQRALPVTAVRALAGLATVKRSIARSGCPELVSAAAFDEGCNVAKDGDGVDCRRRPGVLCHVKDATVAFNRMGDMGKLPTSAWLHLWQNGGVGRIVDEVIRQEQVPTKRAVLLVDRLARVHRVGEKIATMFVSALSTPALAPGLTPWFPDIDGNELVVVDTNVARAADTLREPDAPKTYHSRARWVREQAAQLDLREFRPDLPTYSPRLVQQALYAFCSKSNRVARGDACAELAASCTRCSPTLCPFAAATC